MNKRSAYGPGTYLTSDLDTAKSYSNAHGFFAAHPCRYDSTQNPASIKSCVAIVEVIKHPSIRVVHFGGTPVAGLLDTNTFDDTSSNRLKYYVINSDELMRLKHLLVFY